MQLVRNPGAIPDAVVQATDSSLDERLAQAIHADKDVLRKLHDEELPLCPWDWDKMEMVFPDWHALAQLAQPPWHNPAKLSGEQVGVGEGWRLLCKEEIGVREPSKGISMWIDGRWSDPDLKLEGSDRSATYRTKLPYPIPKGYL